MTGWVARLPTTVWTVVTPTATVVAAVSGCARVKTVMRSASLAIQRPTYACPRGWEKRSTGGKCVCVCAAGWPLLPKVVFSGWLAQPQGGGVAPTY